MAPKQSIDAYNEAYRACKGVEWTTHYTERTIGYMTERVEFRTQVSPDGKWIRVEQREYSPMLSYLAWPISEQKMDAEARKINPRARVEDDRIPLKSTQSSVYQRWVRTYRVQD